MKAASIGFLTVLALAHAGQVEVTPVQKVITLLGGMLEKGKAEKHAEQLTFAKSRQFCDDKEVGLVKDIKQEDRTIKGLTAMISKDTADAASLSKKITGLQKDEDTWAGDKKAATKVRQIEAADYQQTHKDYTESVDALNRAIAMLKKQAFDRAQKEGTSLVQGAHPAIASLLDLGLVPAGAKRSIDMFLQQGEEQSALAKAAPAANGYEFQASGITDMLAKLQDKFIDERTSLEKEEANAKHSFQLLVQDLDAQIGSAEKDESGKKVDRSGKLQSKAQELSDKKEEVVVETVDTVSLKDLKASCTMTAKDFEAAQKLRTEELQQIEKAVEIISSNSVAGSAQKHLPALMQKKAKSLAQLRSISSNTQMQQHVVEFLLAQAKKFNSRVLSTVAERATADPFEKVKKMLKDLVVRLMEEANEESTHKGYCDTELSTNAQTRKEKSSAVETLSAAIDQITASIAKLSGDAQDLTKSVAGLNSAMAEKTNLRNEEKKQNTAAIQDAEDAQTALAQANTVLKEFYSKAALIQQPYQGMKEESGGVLAMLEIIESDFARLSADTKAAEASAQKDHDTFMSDSKADRASKNTAIEHKQAKKQDQTQALTEKKTDLAETQKSLDAALTYYDKLKPSCVDSGASYDDRAVRRKDEIESLQEALKIMNGQ